MEKGKFLAEHFRSQIGIDVRNAYCDRKGIWYHVLQEFPGVYFDYAGCVLFASRAEFDASRHLFKFLRDGARGEKTLEILGGLASLPGYRRLTPPPGSL